MARAALLVVLIYLAWWHVAFTAMFMSRGDSIAYKLYFLYVREFLFGSGLEIPTIIQLAAISLTLLTLITFTSFKVTKAIVRKRRP